MKKAFFPILAVIITALTMVFTSCGGDEEEEYLEKQTTAQNVVLKMNGTPTYSCLFFPNGPFSVNYVNGFFGESYSITYGEDDIYFNCDMYTTYKLDSLAPRITDVFGSVDFEVKSFDYKNATKGTVLSVLAVRDFKLYTSGIYSTTHHYHEILSGKITLESYTLDFDEEEVITLRFNNVVIKYSYTTFNGRDTELGEDSTAPQTLTLDGLVMFRDPDWSN